MKELVFSKYLVPRFPTETEEADWWYKNRHKHSKEFMQLKRDGKLKGWRLAYRLEPLPQPKADPSQAQNDNS